MRIGLFVTCLVDLFRPEVGFASVKLLEQAGCQVCVPLQTCCGQPAYNSGDRSSTEKIARNFIKSFAGYDYVVTPSGSCAAMIRHHYPQLFANDPEILPQSRALSEKTWELTSFLNKVLDIKLPPDVWPEEKITLHDSCSGLRELGIRHQPRALLDSIANITLCEMTSPDACCGFGGTFCVKYDEVSNAIVTRKTADILQTGATTLIGGDMGCLLNIAGKLARDGSAIKVRHIAEVLAGMHDTPPIGAQRTKI